ncbi:MAG TPA: hypothetical protein VN999_07435, partial [Thermoanaerobaculia bacterium]|nr:hypothetical protein [Thermoanaerobaculia bacterium]
MAAWRRMNGRCRSRYGRRGVFLAGVVLPALWALPAPAATPAMTAVPATPATTAIAATPATPAAAGPTAPPAPGAVLGGDASPGSVAEARRRVYPALVNISMVKRYFEHGHAR